MIIAYQYNGTDPGFPFPYTIQIQWLLQKNNILQVNTTIQNHHNHEIPLMDGWHPYFILGGKVDNYTLQFISKGRLEYDASLIPTGKWIEEDNFRSGKKIGNTHFDDCFALDPLAPAISISSTWATLKVTPIQGYPYLQIYTPEDRASIAIENLSGVPDCFNNKMGLHYLEPQEIIQFKTAYQILINQPQP